MTWYAWSPIVYGVEHDENDPRLILRTLRVELGEEVDASKLNLSDSQFDELVDAGSVREYPLPEEYRDPGASPQQIMSAKIRAATEGVDTGEIDPQLMSTLLNRPRDITEGNKEVTETGAIVTAPSGPSPE